MNSHRGCIELEEKACGQGLPDIVLPVKARRDMLVDKGYGLTCARGDVFSGCNEYNKNIGRATQSQRIQPITSL